MSGQQRIKSQAVMCRVAWSDRLHIRCQREQRERRNAGFHRRLTDEQLQHRAATVPSLSGWFFKWWARALPATRCPGWVAGKGLLMPSLRRRRFVIASD